VAAVNADASWLRIAGRSLPPDLNPWSPPGTYVASFDFIKRPEALRPIEALRWDLVVVDEAHAAGLATDRRAAIDAIARTARQVLLLTATPPADALQFAALCRIGAAADEEGPVFFQRGPGSEREPGRRSILLATRLSVAERRLHRLLERYTTLVWREAVRSGNANARLATIVLRKRALSSAASLAQSLERRKELLAGVRRPEDVQLLLPLGDQDDEGLDEAVSDELLGAAGLLDAASEQRWLQIVLDAALSVAVEGKVRVLLRLLRRIREPALVFTEYRDTLERLRGALEQAGLPVSVLHGGLSAAERRDALTGAGRSGGALLATDAASEGLNLQHAFRIVIHFELPWNPMRLLQRAGRVDRIGQRHRVHEVAFVASDTAEALVLAPLARRALGRFAGGGRRMLQLLTESQVARAVFEGRPCDPPAQTATSRSCRQLDLAVESLQEVRRLTRHRAIARSTAARGRQISYVPVAVVRRSSLLPGVVLVFDLKGLSADGQVVQRSLTAIQMALTVAQWPRQPQQLRRELARYLPGLLEAAAPTLERVSRAALDNARAVFLQASDRARQRERAIAATTRSAAMQLVQAGLFDRPERLSRSTRHLTPGGDLLEPPETDRRPADLTSSADLRAVLLVSAR
jgi:hypothetical protein